MWLLECHLCCLFSHVAAEAACLRQASGWISIVVCAYLLAGNPAAVLGLLSNDLHIQQVVGTFACAGLRDSVYQLPAVLHLSVIRSP
jgi:hypothetical protein